MTVTGRCLCSEGPWAECTCEHASTHVRACIQTLTHAELGKQLHSDPPPVPSDPSWPLPSLVSASLANSSSYTGLSPWTLCG